MKPPSRPLRRARPAREKCSFFRRLFPGALTAVAIVFCLHQPLRAQADNTPAPASLDAILETVRSRNNVPGLAAMVLRGDRIVAQGKAGVRKRGSREPVSIDDKFLLCSAAKAMTGTVAALAVDEGRLSWNTTLGEVFSDAADRLHPDWKPVTLAQLLEHRAGAPTDGQRIWTLLRTHFSKKSPEEKRRTVVRKILSRPPEYRPGSRYAYSNAGYMIVSAMLEKTGNPPWEESMRRQLWEPLGIVSGGFGAPGNPGEIDQPWGHWGMLATGRPAPPGGFWSRLITPRFYGPAGTTHMTIGDWGKFASLHLRGDPANPRSKAKLLRASSFETLHRVERGRFYQSGWIVLNRHWAKGPRPGDNGRVVTSQGDNGFWHCEAWVAPEVDLAVLVVCNQGGAAPQKPAARASKEIVDTLTGQRWPE